tara:strand:+ start:218 stop:664 length:447 start_codon:yes stop_codon:yes gene_type:complete
MSGKVVKIGISEKHGNQIENVNEVEAIQGKGLKNDRHFSENNESKNQLTLIELENINYYNRESNTNIPAINFRRNIVTEGVRLNDLVNIEFLIGEIKVKGLDLCRPCISLQKSLSQKKLVKKLLLTGGLRCEILSNGKISVGDIIKLI